MFSVDMTRFFQELKKIDVLVFGRYFKTCELCSKQFNPYKYFFNSYFILRGLRLTRSGPVNAEKKEQPKFGQPADATEQKKIRNKLAAATRLFTLDRVI